jgi:cell division protease FtsH
MLEFIVQLASTAAFLAVAAIVGYWLYLRYRSRSLSERIRAHFRPLGWEQIKIVERRFPFHMRADLQRALEPLLAESAISLAGSVAQQHAFEEVTFTGLMSSMFDKPSPLQYEEVDVGDEQPVQCLNNGVWLMRRDGTRCGLLCAPLARCGEAPGIRVQVAAANDDLGRALTDAIFQRLERAIAEARCYRGKILSFEMKESYSGEQSGVTVHRLPPVAREQLILQRATLDLLSRNVINFVGQRPRLAAAGLATKKGLLFYGPPGTGKTHTIHYLAGALKDHTMLLISAEQVRWLANYLTLARLLQPSIVVLEDVDLIARDRASMNDPFQESLLNKLLNEMDGLKPSAEILFILTTNRPENLEAALVSRPGRIDQAIEFPLPDAECREKLARLYARGMTLTSELVGLIVERTEGVSAAFIKELMRRSMQFQLERDGARPLEAADVSSALDEMVFRGGSLNLKLLGGERLREPNPTSPSGG